MNYLVSYDISKDSLRTRVGDRLIADGLDRIQKSVYLGVVSEEVKVELIKWLKNEILMKGDIKTDTVIMIPLLARNVKEAVVLGKNNYDLDFLSGEKNSLYL
jgi:CRISPR-associated endonuclease Cas2